MFGIRSCSYLCLLLSLSLLAIQANAEESQQCGEDVECPEEETIVVKGDPDENTDQFHQCMQYLNDARICSGGSVGVNDPASNPTNSASDNCEGSGCINYERSYSGFNPQMDCPEGTYATYRGNHPVCMHVPSTEEIKRELCIIGAGATCAAACMAICPALGPGALVCTTACGGACAAIAAEVCE